MADAEKQRDSLEKLVQDYKEGRITRRRFMKRGLALGLALPILGALLAACGGDDEEAAPPPAEPAEPEPAPAEPAPPPAPAAPTGTVRFLNAENFWADWSPFASSALSQIRLERQVYDYLVDFPSGDLTQPEPMLATSWRQLDELTWEFELRDGVKFHDGQPLTAEDVKASVELASGFSGETTYGGLWWTPVEVEVVDNLTVRLKTETPFAPMLSSLWWYAPILSGPWLGGDPDRLKREPNGTGAFRLAEQTVEVKTLEANVDYWRDPPPIQTVIWEFIQDPDTRLNAFLAGEADVLDRVPPQHLSILEREEGVELQSFTAIEQINLYVRPGRLPIWDENPNFRKALNWSFDRAPLVDNLVLGNSRLAESFIPNNALFYKPQQPAYRFDPEQAQAELEAAGVPDGGPEFELWVPEGFQPRAPEVVEAIVAQMQQVGLKPKVVTTDVAGTIDDIFSETGTGAVYHLSWATNGDPDPAAQVYSSRFAWYFGDERLQQLIDQGRTTIDPAQREQVYAELQQHMWEQVWHAPLYYSDFTLAHKSNLQGLLVQPNVLRTDFHSAQLVS